MKHIVIYHHDWDIIQDNFTPMEKVRLRLEFLKSSHNLKIIGNVIDLDELPSELRTKVERLVKS